MQTNNKEYYYLWVDDDIENTKITVGGIMEQARDMGYNLVIETIYPVNMEELVDNIAKRTHGSISLQEADTEETQSLGKKIDGLITDLRLDISQSGKASKVRYRGATLVEEIRQRIYEFSASSNSTTPERIEDLPIILVSSYSYIEKQISQSSPEFILFDDRFLRDNLVPEKNNKDFIIKLISYADGYQTIKKAKKSTNDSIIEIFNLDNNNQHWLHPEVKTYVQNFKNLTTYKFVQFILQELLNRAGIFVNEKYLAARLGVDIEQSNDDWNLLLSKLNAAKYRGVFSLSHPCWWFSGIEDIWEKISPDKYLESMKASERVAILQKSFNLLGLKAANAIGNPLTEDTHFWCICEALDKPLALGDAFALYEEQLPKHWQSKIFISKSAAIKGTIPKGAKLTIQDETEVKRLQNLLNKKK